MTGWPAAPGEAAFHGPAGEFVLRTEPHSEAHPMALLAQFLVAFGTACGRGAHYTIEADDHYPNEFCVLVGPSGKGRKGSSWGHVRRALAEADPGFVHGCLASGLSSGEGLIAQVRDAVNETDADAPVDKRRLVLVQEFAQVLKVLAREGNTLSPIVRQAWDGDALQTMVRNNPLRASAAHIGIVGHITKDELLRYLTATELANGFQNRFLLVARSTAPSCCRSAAPSTPTSWLRSATLSASPCSSPPSTARFRSTQLPASDGSRSIRTSRRPSRDWPVRRPRARRRTSSGSR